MARVRAKKRIGVKTSPDDPVIEFPAGLIAPARLVLTIDDPKHSDPEGFDLELEIVYEGGRYVCRELRVRQAEGGPPVTGEALRGVTVKELMRMAISLMLDAKKAGEEDRELRRRRPPEGLAKQGPTDEVLRWVAQIYELAYALNDPPTKAVQDELNVSRATAGRWVAAAREHGLLSPPTAEDEGQ